MVLLQYPSNLFLLLSLSVSACTRTQFSGCETLQKEFMKSIDVNERFYFFVSFYFLFYSTNSSNFIPEQKCFTSLFITFYSFSFHCVFPFLFSCSCCCSALTPLLCSSISFVPQIHIVKGESINQDAYLKTHEIVVEQVHVHKNTSSNRKRKT